MKKIPLIPMFSACIALVCAVLLFVNWNPEPLFQSEQPLVTIRDIEQNRQADFTGLPAGEDIPGSTVQRILQKSALQRNM